MTSRDLLRGPAAWLRRIRRRLRPAEEPASVAPAPTLVVPEKFNRNSFKVSSLMPAEESGAWLLERMRQQIGLETYAASKLLDFGCGVRFSEAVLNKRIPIGAYAGIDCFAEMIDFLRSSVSDPRFSCHFLDAYHPLYNPNGTRSPRKPGSPCRAEPSTSSRFSRSSLTERRGASRFVSELLVAVLDSKKPGAKNGKASLTGPTGRENIAQG